MKDFLDQDLEVYDQVVYLSHGRTSSCFLKARIAGFTPKMVKLCHINGNENEVATVTPGKIIRI